MRSCGCDPVLAIRLADDAARIDLEPNDLHLRLGHSTPKGRRGKGAGARRERHSYGLVILADRNVGDAFQALAQRHFDRGRARWSRDASNLGKHTMDARVPRLRCGRWSTASKCDEQHA